MPDVMVAFVVLEVARVTGDEFEYTVYVPAKGQVTVMVVPLADTVGIPGVARVVMLDVAGGDVAPVPVELILNVYDVFPAAPVNAHGLPVLAVVRVGVDVTVGVVNPVPDPVAARVIVPPFWTTDVIVGAEMGVTDVDAVDEIVLPDVSFAITTKE